ncbi:PEP-CTERM putative exosortase interaction domain-containing protein [Opitutaceae bacterium TAV1]|nr:PEP-CTERM putative exosortase interaction domain-containing protein [Opitutaceae bacterium TAV1]
MYSRPISSPVFSPVSRSRFTLPLLFSLMCAAVAPAQSVFDVSETNGNFNANGTWVLLSGSGTRPTSGDQIAIISTNLTANIEVAFPSDGTVASLVYGTADEATDIARSIVFRGSGDVSHSLTITGDLTKYDSGTLTFRHRGSSGGELNLAIGGDVNLHAGTLNFGIDASGTRHLRNVSVGGSTQISGGTLNLRLLIDSSLGTLVLNGGTLNLNAGGVENTETKTTFVRSLSGTGGTIGETTTGTGATFTLAITGEPDETSATTHTWSGTITDGSGTGSVAVKKSGVATQVLAGANTYEGGTIVDGGALVVSGSLASTGAVSVAANAAFVAAAMLEVGNLTLANEAILGFDLAQNASLKINGDLDTTGMFTIDFRNTGEAGQLYTGLLTVTGTGADFGTVNFINFGSDGLAGQLTAGQLAGSFTIGAIPEPSHLAALLATVCGVVVFLIRRRRVRE